MATSCRASLSRRDTGLLAVRTLDGDRCEKDTFSVAPRSMTVANFRIRASLNPPFMTCRRPGRCGPLRTRSRVIRAMMKCRRCHLHSTLVRRESGRQSVEVTEERTDDHSRKLIVTALEDHSMVPSFSSRWLPFAWLAAAVPCLQPWASECSWAAAGTSRQRRRQVVVGGNVDQGSSSYRAFRSASLQKERAAHQAALAVATWAIRQGAIATCIQEESFHVPVGMSRL